MTIHLNLDDLKAEKKLQSMNLKRPILQYTNP